MEILTITREFDGIDYLGQTQMFSYKWSPTNDELKNQYSLRLLFSTKKEAIAYDDEARSTLLDMIQGDKLQYE